MPAAACPACADAAHGPPGGSVRCPQCATDYWVPATGGTGEAFTGVLSDRAGAGATLWSAVAATGVLAALLGILAAEVWGVLRLIDYLRA